MRPGAIIAPRELRKSVVEELCQLSFRYFRRIYAVGYQQPPHHFLIISLPNKINLCH